MKTIKIKPVTTGISKRTGVSIDIDPINLKLFKDNCDVYWRILDQDNLQVDHGNLNIPSEVYLKWGDDEVIVNEVLKQLGLERLIDN